MNKRKQQLKGPDAFQQQMASGLQWLSHYKTQFAIIGAVVVVILGGALGWRYLDQRQVDKRQEELAAIDSKFREEIALITDDRQKMVDELTKLRQEEIKLKDEKKGTAENAKQQEALRSKLEVLLPDHTASGKEFKAFAEKEKDNPEGWAAGLRAASIYLDKRQVQEARGLLEGILKASLDHKFYQIQSRWAYVNVLEEMGEYEPALKETEILLGLVEDDLKPSVLLTKGRLQYLKNAKAEASETFDSLIKNHGTSQEAQQAKSLKALLN